MKEYFSGYKLYGDDLTLKEIEKWYKEESEGYANLGSNDEQNYFYAYHELNRLHGFNKIKGNSYNNVLGLGSAYGVEFEPILHKIKNLTILEPSDQLISNKLGALTPSYVKPTIEGTLPFPDNSFDLITSFGTLHHIPNVSYVLSEIIRVLKPGGDLLIREPITSMGDWTKSRPGLTKHERGIPVDIFDKIFDNCNVKVINKAYCFTMSSLFQRNLGRFFKKPVFSYRTYVVLDKYLSKILKGNLHYHATSKVERIAPSNVFYIIRK